MNSSFHQKTKGTQSCPLSDFESESNSRQCFFIEVSFEKIQIVEETNDKTMSHRQPQPLFNIFFIYFRPHNT